MAVINNPPASDNGSTGMVLGIVLLLAILFFIFYGLPRMYSAPASSPSMPSGSSSQDNQAPNVQIPDKIDVNINQNPQGQPQQ